WATLLRLFHLWAPRLHQIRFQNEFLVWSEIEFRVEGLVSGQGDGNLAMSRRDDQALGNPAKLGSVADELSVEKHGRAVGIHRHLDFCRDRGHDEPRVFRHGDGDQLLSAWLQHEVAREVLITVLTDR